MVEKSIFKDGANKNLTHPKRKIGISLIVLIITIIILAILAAAIIISILNTGIINSAKDAVKQNSQSTDMEKINLAFMDYDIARGTGENITVTEFFQQEDWCSNVTYNENSKHVKIVTSENRKYTVLDDRTIVPGTFDYIVKNATDLHSTINKAANSEIIGISGDISITGNLGNGTAKALYLVGVNSSSSLKMDSATSQAVSLTIENLIIKTAGTLYTGFNSASGNTLKYVNCTFDNQYFTFAKQVEFENCTFNQTSADAYNIWTYSAEVCTFTNCTFNSNGKSVLVYNEGIGVESAVVNLSGCTLIASSPASGKAAIEIDSTSQAFEVNIDNCTSIGFDKGSVSGNTLWNQKKGTKATVTVDGQEM